ncbi:MAG: lytic murein transglycosylase B [Zoogloeaceae bacterium]|jgi:membrane-bound lytic murein transglycosylase B|nr:lytic murein transglycosylase B [Zoogloeaceae bacterium]
MPIRHPFRASFFCALLLLSATAFAQDLAQDAFNMAGLPEAQDFIHDMRDRNGMDAQDLFRRFSRLTPNARVLRLIAPPTSPLQRSWQRYRARFLDDIRIGKGARFWRQNAAALSRARERYGVPEEIIVAIIGIETLYGHDTGRFNTFSALATLAFYEPRRADYFRQELEQLLLLARENQRDPEHYTGSYAGALGIPQFMPGSQRRYAVDFDNDGVIDLAASVEDAIGSVANFLAMHGWQEGAPIAVPARLPEHLSAQKLAVWLEAGIRPALPAKTLLDEGVVAQAQPGQIVTLVDLVTPDAPTEYWLGHENFYVITRYNRSSFYAMSVFLLAGEIKKTGDARPGYGGKVTVEK